MVQIPEVVITRIDSGDQGTFGKLVTDGFSCFTGELPWRDNQANISSLPAGEYLGTWTFSAHFNRFMYVITPTTGRSGIRIHEANFMGDKTKKLRCQLNGCIALGERMGVMDGQKALLLSRPAVNRFERFMKGRTFKLVIK